MVQGSPTTETAEQSWFEWFEWFSAQVSQERTTSIPSTNLHREKRVTLHLLNQNGGGRDEVGSYGPQRYECLGPVPGTCEYFSIWKKCLSGGDLVKDLEMGRVAWFAFRVGPKCRHECPPERKAAKDLTAEEKALEAERGFQVPVCKVAARATGQGR